MLLKLNHREQISDLMDTKVFNYLELNDPKKKAYKLFIVGVAYSIYSESDQCRLYARRKQVKRQALDHLKASYDID
eukprot:CAMPEP_0170552452 /NCGR_PEP_ID=MMETSP0211-20121228/10336_1 /TAXON_ID=311385 /ORGANISM="Pseudokeronopsis sp., Strain OXSARD2" /LENGTH=75 /DNA_ID=CAMNT_0010860177 /DNA_START=551 /DNA_END=778 /DNA_ORIENTATION=+